MEEQEEEGEEEPGALTRAAQVSKHPSSHDYHLTHTHMSISILRYPTIYMSIYIHTPTHIHTALGVALGVKSRGSKSILTGTHAMDAPAQTHTHKRGRNTPPPQPPLAATSSTTIKRPRSTNTHTHTHKKKDDYEDAYQSLLARTKGQAQSQAFLRHEQAKKKHILTHGKRYICVCVCVYIFIHYSFCLCIILSVRDD